MIRPDDDDRSITRVKISNRYEDILVTLQLVYFSNCKFP